MKLAFSHRSDKSTARPVEWKWLGLELFPLGPSRLTGFVVVLASCAMLTIGCSSKADRSGRAGDGDRNPANAATAAKLETATDSLRKLYQSILDQDQETAFSLTTGGDSVKDYIAAHIEYSFQIEMLNMQLASRFGDEGKANKQCSEARFYLNLIDEVPLEMAGTERVNWPINPKRPLVLIFENGQWKSDILGSFVSAAKVEEATQQLKLLAALTALLTGELISGEYNSPEEALDSMAKRVDDRAN